MEGEGSEPKPRRTVDDALAYLKTVKDKFRDDRAKYDTFLTILRNFKAQRIDENTCIKEVEKLINGDQDLIRVSINSCQRVSRLVKEMVE